MKTKKLEASGIVMKLQSVDKVYEGLVIVEKVNLSNQGDPIKLFKTIHVSCNLINSRSFLCVHQTPFIDNHED